MSTRLLELEDLEIINPNLILSFIRFESGNVPYPSRAHRLLCISNPGGHRRVTLTVYESYLNRAWATSPLRILSWKWAQAPQTFTKFCGFCLFFFMTKHVIVTSYQSRLPRRSLNSPSLGMHLNSSDGKKAWEKAETTPVKVHPSCDLWSRGPSWGTVTPVVTVGSKRALSLSCG